MSQALGYLVLALVAAFWTYRQICVLRYWYRCRQVARPRHSCRGVRIVYRRGGRLAPPCDTRAHNPRPIHGDRVRLLTSAPEKSTLDHRAQRVVAFHATRITHERLN